MILIPIIISVLIAAAFIMAVIAIGEDYCDRPYGILIACVVGYFGAKGTAFLIFLVWVGWAVMK